MGLDQSIGGNNNASFPTRTTCGTDFKPKYMFETIDGANYNGFTDLVGIEERYDLTKK